MDETKALKDALAFIRTNHALVAFVRDFDESKYFFLSIDPRFNEIETNIGGVHSGSSLEWCLRRCQHILRSPV